MQHVEQCTQWCKSRHEERKAELDLVRRRRKEEWVHHALRLCVSAEPEIDPFISSFALLGSSKDSKTLAGATNSNTFLTQNSLRINSFINPRTWQRKVESCWLILLFSPRLIVHELGRLEVDIGPFGGIPGGTHAIPIGGGRGHHCRSSPTFSELKLAIAFTRSGGLLFSEADGCLGWHRECESTKILFVISKFTLQQLWSSSLL